MTSTESPDTESPDTEGLVASSGVTRDLVAFCVLSLHGEVLVQISPNQLREIALGWLQLAESAEHDALTARMLIREVGMTQAAAAGFLGQMRRMRAAVQAESDAYHDGAVERAE